MAQTAHDLSAARLSALAQPTRLRIIEVIAAGEPEGTAAGAIARSVDCPASTLSFHLKELAQSGLLEARPRGRFILYAIQPEAFRTLAEFVAQLPGRPPEAPPAGRGRARGRRKDNPDEATHADQDAQLSIF